MMKYHKPYIIWLFVVSWLLVLAVHGNPVLSYEDYPVELVRDFSTQELSIQLVDQLAQANDYQRKGLYRRSRKQLESLQQLLSQASDSEIKVKGLLQLANVLNITGNAPEQTLAILTQAQSIADRIDPDLKLGLIALTQFHQGNFHLFWGKPVKAKMAYEQALQNHPSERLRSIIQVRNLSLRFNTPASKRENLASQWTELVQQVEKSPLTATNLYLRLELADLAQNNVIFIAPELRQRLLVESLQVANHLNDLNAATNILGQLGKIHFQANKLILADRNARQALHLAQRMNNTNLIYRNFHLLGQIEVKLNHLEQAKLYYQSAIDVLQHIRYDLVATSPNLQFEFREEVEPIYRELVDLLLTPQAAEIPPSQLKQAQEVMDSLRDAELVNYFREACWDVSPQAVAQLDPKAAIVYPIVLADRLEVLWNLPGQPLQHYRIPVDAATVETLVSKMRVALRSTSLLAERRSLAQELYNWLIRPALPQLQSNPDVTTLVFNPDTAFQLLPMNMLYDGKQFLIEQYAIATIPRLKLRPSLAPNQIQWQGDRSFIGGISESQGESNALPGVTQELDSIAEAIRSSTHRNQDLKISHLQNAISKTPIALLHLATHGQFGASPEETFLQLWGDRLKVKDLGIFFEERTINQLPPLELLILSACQTAQGDRRAALGIAGIAIQSGARSTIASLWKVDDQSTALLMKYLYQNLNQNMTRAEALRQAQLKLLKHPEFSHPYYWSAFSLLGAWW
jgi:CHAT domain-containing protein